MRRMLFETKWTALRLIAMLCLLSAAAAFGAESLSRPQRETPAATPSLQETPTATPTVTSPIQGSVIVNGTETVLSWEWIGQYRYYRFSDSIRHGDKRIYKFRLSGRPDDPLQMKYYHDTQELFQARSTTESDGSLVIKIAADIPARTCVKEIRAGFDAASPGGVSYRCTLFLSFQDYPENDDLLTAQGSGGRSIWQIRNYDSSRGQMTNIIGNFNATGESFARRIGGLQRGVSLTPGDLNGDGVQDWVLTFGPVQPDGFVEFPNIVIPRDGRSLEVIGHSFVAFPKGSEQIHQYNYGEVKAVVGNFTGTAPDQIAVAQGIGGHGTVRLYQYTGKPAPYGYKVIGQYPGLTGPAWTDNANGGLNLAAGDLDEDGLDELIVSQTYSRTSSAQIQVLDIDAEGNVARRFSSAAFTSLGIPITDTGVEVTVCDLDGDGKKEVVAAAQSPTLYQHYKLYNLTAKNLISVLEPDWSPGVLTGLHEIEGSVWPGFFYEDQNPSGVVHITSGEFTNCRGDGEEIVISTGVLRVIQDGRVVESLPASQSFYDTFKMKSVETPIPYGILPAYIHFPAAFGFLPAFISPYSPGSGEINPAVKRVIR